MVINNNNNRNSNRNNIPPFHCFFCSSKCFWLPCYFPHLKSKFGLVSGLFYFDYCYYFYVRLSCIPCKFCLAFKSLYFHLLSQLEHWFIYCPFGLCSWYLNQRHMFDVWCSLIFFAGFTSASRWSNKVFLVDLH